MTIGHVKCSNDDWRLTYTVDSADDRILLGR